eukprot:GEMP01082216.1.p1 GENE.GEMP01082216.1~~GEMP01082216.1.p1  ORF type:complete len:198 (+),score=43.77 GEMP01082216.1:89-682(+)
MAKRTYKLSFNNEGACQGVRLALQIAGIQYESVHIRNMDEWKSLNATSTCVLTIDDDTVITQWTTILRYAGRLGGLYPDDSRPITGLYIDEMMDILRDLRGKIIPCIMERDESRKAEQIELLKSDVLPNILGKMENVVKSNKTGYCIGKSCTIADLELASLMTWLSTGRQIPSDIMKDYPACLAVREKVLAHPKVKK